MLKGSPNAPAVDAYLKDSFEVIRMVHDRLPEIRAIAGRLTPVEDLIEFQAEVTALYDKLALLTEASQIIIQITDAGFDLMTAEDVAHQRMLLELGSAALRDESYFAKEDAFLELKEVVTTLRSDVDGILEKIPTFVSREEFDALKLAVESLDDGGVAEIIDEIEITFPDGSVMIGVSRALMELYARTAQLREGYELVSGRLTELDVRLGSQDGRLDAQAQLTELLQTSIQTQGQNIDILSQSGTELKTRLDNVDSGVFAEGSALNFMQSRISQTADGVEIISQTQNQMDARLRDTEDGVVAQAQSLEQSLALINNNAQGISILGQQYNSVTASLSGVGNLLPNAGFEFDTTGWSIFTRGAGWASGEMLRDENYDNGIPEGTIALRITNPTQPTGNMGVRSNQIPVEALKRYMVSAYLSCSNCTARLECRVYNAAGQEMTMQVIAQVTNQLRGFTLSGWVRNFNDIPIPNGAAFIRLFLWAQSPTGIPNVWMLRPMIEEMVPQQERPSPWSPSSAGIGASFAEASEKLRVSIEQSVDGKLEIVAENIDSVRVETETAKTNAQSALTATQDLAQSVNEIRFENLAPFNAASGWEFTANHRGFTTVGAVMGQWPVTANDGATVIESQGNDPQFISPIFSLAGGPNPIIRAYIRRRTAGLWDGRVFWSNNNHGFSALFVAGAVAPPVGEWAVVEWDLRDNADFRSSPINRLRFDFGASPDSIVDVKWIVLGNYGQGRSAQVTETMRVGVDSVTGRLNATYGFALDVNGKVAGMRAANDGVISNVEFLVDAFRVISSGMQGFEIQNGYQRNYSNGAQLIIGHAFGTQQDLTLWYGPNIGAAACTKANATIWFDKSGNAYFGGQVAQGVLRFFNSNTTYGNVSVETANNVSNSKPVQVVGRFQFDSFQGFSGQVFLAPASGTTSATIILERLYQGESWVELGRRNVSGNQSLINGTDGDGSVQWYMDGNIAVTDVASAKLRAYRLRVANLSTQTYTKTGTGSELGQRTYTQYQSIESLE